MHGGDSELVHVRRCSVGLDWDLGYKRELRTFLCARRQTLRYIYTQPAFKHRRKPVLHAG